LGEAIEEIAGFVADAGVDGARLQNRAAGRREPVEALALGETGDGPGGSVALTDAGDGVEVLADEIGVGLGPESAQALWIESDAAVEVALFETEYDDGGVDEFLAFDAGDDAEDGVIKRGGHGSPPVRRWMRLRGDG
jgi:hypothetical protein